MACLLQSVSGSAHSIMKTLPRSLASTWGTTAAERTPSFPCDRFLVPFDAAYFRAVPIRAPASLLFRWLCQLRVAPYSYDWIDNGGHLSPRELIPGLDQLQVGQRVMTIFQLVDFEPNQHLYWLLRISVLKKSAHVGTTSSFSLLSIHRI